MGTHQVYLTGKAPTAREILYAEYGNSKNLFTPSVLKRGKAGKWRAWELSMGRGIFSDHMFGVSVVDVDPETGETDRHKTQGQSFPTREQADRFIVQLKAGEI